MGELGNQKLQSVLVNEAYEEGLSAKYLEFRGEGGHEGLGRYQLQLLSIVKHMDCYWLCVIRTMLPPLSDCLIIISEHLCKDLSALV